MNNDNPLFMVNLPAWSTGQMMAFRFWLLFVLLFMISVPFPHPFIPDLPSALAPFFEGIVQWVGDHFFHPKRTWSARIISDSTGMYIHLLVLVIISLFACMVWSMADRKRSSHHVLAYWFRVVMSYYLAFFLFSYGLNKIFKWQFFFPEPNTLYTPLGETYRDILYWSTMGTSRSYNIFLGSLEIIAGLLLLFRRTRLAGSGMAFMIMLNVVAVNFSFDISVKVFSCFLLLLSVLIAWPDSKRLYMFFFRREWPPPGAWEPVYVSRKTRRVHVIIKSILCGWMLVSLLTIYIRTGNYNDDKAPRPLFHGAYEVTLFIINRDTLPPLFTNQKRWKRVFIHRRDYLIVQGMQDQMISYHFLPDTARRQWFITDELNGQEIFLDYEQVTDSTLVLKTEKRTGNMEIHLQKINLEKLPLLRKEFNWTVDQ